MRSLAMRKFGEIDFHPSHGICIAFENTNTEPAVQKKHFSVQIILMKRTYITVRKALEAGNMIEQLWLVRLTDSGIFCSDIL